MINIINGYCIRGTTDLQLVEMELNKTRKKLKEISDRQYHLLLGEEAAFLYDCVALNYINQKEGERILDAAIGNVKARIQRAMDSGTANKYNLGVFVHIMTFENDTYLKLICPNEHLLKAFGHLAPYSLSESECNDQHNKKNILWQKLHALYASYTPIALNMTYLPEPDTDKLVFPSKSERIDKMARHSLLNRYLSVLAGSSQIPPFRLHECLDQAYEMLMTEEGKAELKERKDKLERIITSELNKDLF
uniref:hypothetical protein n=1 Tax=Lachnoclostridium phocaeense TaxID=1871021 RepID=UPI0026DBC6AF|nr:hypothetical protein [Lachnoclostridium phocaeense]